MKNERSAQLFQEVGHAAGLLPAPAPRGGLEVAAPVQHRVAVLADVLVQVLLVHLHADRVHAPHVLGPPVPALPAVGLARLQRVAAAQVQHHGLAAVRGVDHLGLAVPVGLAQDGQGAVLVVDALDLGGNEGGGLVPRDALVLGHAAVARVALPLRVPVHALHRVQHAVLRIDALLVAQGQRREQRLVAGLEHLAARLDAPGPALLHARDVVVVQRADAQHLAVLHVDACRVGAARERGPRDAAIDRVAPRLRTHEHHPLLVFGARRRGAKDQAERRAALGRRKPGSRHDCGSHHRNARGSEEPTGWHNLVLRRLVYVAGKYDGYTEPRLPRRYGLSHQRGSCRRRSQGGRWPP